MQDPLPRFLAKTERTAGGCLLWTGCRLPNGYATFSVNGKPVYVHRWAYEHFVGPIPDGLQVDHTCHGADCHLVNDCPHRRCAEPTHLEPVSCRTNLLRGNTPTAANAAKTHCPAGHPYTGDNVAVYRGSRKCVTCSRTKALAWFYRQKAGVA